MKHLEKTISKYNKTGVGHVMSYSLNYPLENNFIVNKQYDNKNFCVVNVSPNGSELILGVFKRKKIAVEFGKELGLTLIKTKLEAFTQNSN